MSDSEEDWTPPSEAQMKVIQAKRERSDKISKLMGDYLLKGYKMLATSCGVCYTVELQDRSGLKFCVACQEVDCHETSKDDPALSQHAAERVVEEQAFSSSNNTTDDRQQQQPQQQSTSLSTVNTPSPPTASCSRLSSLQTTVLPSTDLAPTPVRGATDVAPLPPVRGAGAVPRSAAPAARARPAETMSSLPAADGDSTRSLISHSVATVTNTLDTANRDLETCHNTEKQTQLIILIREAATTLVTLKHLLCDNN